MKIKQSKKLPKLPGLKTGSQEYFRYLMAHALRQVKERGQSLPNKCLLCTGKPTEMGLFVPKNPVPWGGKKGIPRVCLYAICQDCLDQPNGEDRVERKLISNGRFN